MWLPQDTSELCVDSVPLPGSNFLASDKVLVTILSLGGTIEKLRPLDKSLCQFSFYSMTQSQQALHACMHDLSRASICGHWSLLNHQLVQSVNRPRALATVTMSNSSNETRDLAFTLLQ